MSTALTTNNQQNKLSNHTDYPPSPPPTGFRRPHAIVPRTPQELLDLSSMYYLGGLVPKGAGRKESVAAIIAYGMELGLTPAISINSIYIVNGRATIWGDTPLGLVQSSGLLEDIDETEYTDGENVIATCTVKRKGKAAISYSYSIAEAIQAGLMTKKGPWQTDPKWMLRLRARSRALRMAFADVLAGLTVAEDTSDPVVVYTTTDVAKVEDGTESPTLIETAAEVAPGPMTHEQMERISDLMPKWWSVNYGVDLEADGVEESDVFATAKEQWTHFLTKHWGVSTIRELNATQADQLVVEMSEPLGAAMFGPQADEVGSDGEKGGESTNSNQ